MRVCEIQTQFGIDSLKLVERPEPQVKPGHVRLRMKAWSLNYRDLMVVRGQYNPKLKFPFVPLSDGVGEVVEVGEGVETVTVGTRVCPLFMPLWQAGRLNDVLAKSALGGAWPGVLAESVVVPAGGVTPVPEHLTDAEAATLPCAAVTAWHGLITAGQIQPGDTVLIQGTGGVSLFALQFARLAGAKVIATSSSDEKLARVLKMGAAHGINYRTQPDWDVAVRELTNGIGVRHIVEVGGAGTLGKSLRAVQTGGTITLIGVLSGGAGEVNPLPILMKNIRVQGIYVGSGEMFAAMNQAISQHQIRPTIDRSFRMEEVQDAFRHLESGQHFGKVVIEN
jgi:NADPH:quinone reductase-like Zn-dependent oxidoreductase